MRALLGQRWLAYLLALLVPAALTAVLVAINSPASRNYVFLYLGVVAVLGLTSGIGTALVSAGASFLLVDFFFVRPVQSLQFADATDLLNLSVFFGAAGLVGTLGSLRRAAQLRAERLSHELQSANVELARLAETERQVRDLEETDRVRRELLANISHELRTPLATILTGSTALQQRRALPEELRPDVALLATEARRLNRLVSDLLDMTRIGGGILDLRLGEVDVAEALDAAVERARRRASEREVAVQVTAGTPEVIADWDRLGQVLDNLVDNAHRAAPAGTAIRLTAGRDGDGVVMRVIDRGPGIPPEARERIFERFVRGPAQDGGSRAGVGLGLAIVRGLVEAQGGRVWVEEARPGEGARFAVSLPAVPEPQEPVA